MSRFVRFLVRVLFWINGVEMHPEMGIHGIRIENGRHVVYFQHMVERQTSEEIFAEIERDLEEAGIPFEVVDYGRSQDLR